MDFDDVLLFYILQVYLAMAIATPLLSEATHDGDILNYDADRRDQVLHHIHAKVNSPRQDVEVAENLEVSVLIFLMLLA